MKNVFLLLAITVSATAFAQNTTNETLEKVITRMADTTAGQAGNWQFVVNDRLLVCLTDENNNRMRIISPVTDVAKLSEEEILNALVANFHTALDVKYAISDEVLWSVFIHPLKELSETQIEDAIIQVYNAAQTFGTAYSSTNLSFPGNTKKIEREKPVELQKG